MLYDRTNHKYLNSGLLPPTLMKETLDIIALLFPPWNKRVKRYLRKFKGKNRLDPSVGDLTLSSVNAFSTEYYKYWKTCILVLKETFEETEPTTLY